MHPNDGRVVSNFIVQAIQGAPVTIYGDGSQTRSFCYVDDLVLGLVRMMENEQTVGPVNLGNPAEITVRELADRVIKLTGSSSRGGQSSSMDRHRQRAEAEGREFGL